ncbi:hypothetical protein L873DRAFT_514698 [Choiromyces venosus 120613-1]|uniref:Uncharacterized protein n=1 Tax=Choiromyces venosus 120613-1 TaxID=1336337 RepID=A0A3N4J802_9PEZI|nr:hypothetical protein L873DRAFT_514698 [Choiromyces venosus 120613-1]
MLDCWIEGKSGPVLENILFKYHSANKLYVYDKVMQLTWSGLTNPFLLLYCTWTFRRIYSFFFRIVPWLLVNQFSIPHVYIPYSTHSLVHWRSNTEPHPPSSLSYHSSHCPPRFFTFLAGIYFLSFFLFFPPSLFFFFLSFLFQLCLLLACQLACNRRSLHINVTVLHK